MKLADRILRQLKQVREFNEKMLEAFQTPEDWTHQIAPGTNHALWFAGHMTTADNYFISKLAPNRKKPLDDWEALFGMGSKPTSNPDQYPPAAEVLDVMRERRAVLLELLAKETDADLAGPPLEGPNDFWPDKGSIYEMIGWHEMLHAGQVSMVRRALGHKPVFSAEPAEAAK
jgi:uncharacterized damage-inducible protein DinB